MNEEWAVVLDHALKVFRKSNEIDRDVFRGGHPTATNYSRVEHLVDSKSFSFTNLVNDFLSRLDHHEINEKKNPESSEQFRKKGNESFCRRDYKTALKFYTLAILNAFAASESLLLGYSNRSAVFYDLKRFEQSLADLTSVKQLLGKSKPARLSERVSLVVKLLSREVNCLLELNRFVDLDQNDFVKYVRKIEFNESTAKNEIESKIEELKKQLSVKIKCSNQSDEIEKITNLKISDKKEGYFISERLDIKFEEKKGRHCVANESISAGECIFVENAYCAIVLPEFVLDYCPVCMKRISDESGEYFDDELNLEPCENCSSILFCSRKCRDRDDRETRNHVQECGVLRKLLHNLGIAHLAYRIVSSTSWDVLKKYAQLEIANSVASDEDLMKIDYKYSKDGDYEQVFHLMTHERDTHVDDLFKYTLTSILLGKLFLSKSNIENNQDNLKIVSCLIVRHLLQSICNAHAITRLQDDTSTRLEQTESGNSDRVTYDRDQIRYATAIYPRVSLLNHSCNSNVISSFKPNSSTIVVKSARNIDRFAEIFNCYGPHFLKMSLLERQQSLWEQYRFRCECDECMRELEGLKSQSNSSLKCLKCKNEELLLVTCEFGFQIKLKCIKCNMSFSYQDYVSLFDKLNMIISQLDLNNTNKAVNRGQIADLGRWVNEYREYLLLNDKFTINGHINDAFRLFYVDFSKLLDSLARLNCNVGDFEIACGLVESNVRILENVYASASKKTSKYDERSRFDIELANELFKLAEIQCNCQKWAQALSNVNRAIGIAENLYSKENSLLEDFRTLKQNILSVQRIK